MSYLDLLPSTEVFYYRLLIYLSNSGNIRNYLLLALDVHLEPISSYSNKNKRQPNQL
nr:MAG TPA: hypothetical protein [Caudoviricetes sp.]